MPTLNRRGFLQSLSAAGLVPFLPALPAAAAPAGHTSIQYVWASYYAKANNACSVPQIMSALNVNPAVAESLMQRLVHMNVLTAPDASGVGQRKARWHDEGQQQVSRAAPAKVNLDTIMRAITRNIASETHQIRIGAIV